MNNGNGSGSSSSNSSSNRVVEENNYQNRGYFSVFGSEEHGQPKTPAYMETELSYARFPLSRPMSPPVRSNYITSPPPRANSTPPANHYLNLQQQQQRQIEDYEYTQLMMNNNNNGGGGNSNSSSSSAMLDKVKYLFISLSLSLSSFYPLIC